jgi:hypothetical protein
MSSRSQARGGLRAAIVTAAFLVPGLVLLAMARNQELIGSETATRGTVVLIGLAVAVWGNAIPKAMSGPPLDSIPLVGMRQGVFRATGWALTLVGLAVAGLWTFAPRDAAQTGTLVAAGILIAVVIGTIIRRGVALHGSSKP